MSTTRAKSSGVPDGVDVPLRANEYLFANDLWLVVLKGLRDGRTFTRFTLDPVRGQAAAVIEFELRVSRIGSQRIPRLKGRERGK